MTVAPGAAVFLDRDGVLIRDVHYLCRVEQIELLSGVAEALRILRSEGFKLVVVTSQSVVASGKVTKAGLREIHRVLRERLGDEGAKLVAIYTARIIRPMELAFTRSPALAANPMPG